MRRRSDWGRGAGEALRFAGSWKGFRFACTPFAGFGWFAFGLGGYWIVPENAVGLSSVAYRWGRNARPASGSGRGVLYSNIYFWFKETYGIICWTYQRDSFTSTAASLPFLSSLHLSPSSPSSPVPRSDVLLLCLPTPLLHHRWSAATSLPCLAVVSPPLWSTPCPT